MDYAVTNLTQVADYDVLLTWAARERADVAFKKTAEERLIVKYAETSVEIDAVLQGVLAEISSLEIIIASLPNGPVKDEQVRKKIKADYKKFLLETRRETYGMIALLQKQSDVARVDQEIESLDEFTSVIEAHKVTLLPS